MLNVPGVSRVHAEISQDSGTLIVKDLVSRNGTFINGERIETSQLEVGNVIAFAGISYVVQLFDDESVSTVEGCADLAPQIRPEIASKLTEAQLKVAKLAISSQAESAIAATLDLSQHTVHNHLRAMYRKFKIGSRPELVALLLRGKVDL